MRHPPLLILLLLALLPRPATSGVAVDTLLRSVETSTFRLRFDPDRPDRVIGLVWKPWGETRDLAVAEGAAPAEAFGQGVLGLAGAPLVDPFLPEEAEWHGRTNDNDSLFVETVSRSEGGPRLTTRWVFADREDWFTVTRTIEFGDSLPDSVFVPFTPRMRPPGPYRAFRRRDLDGVVRLAGFCFQGCTLPAWDGTWSETEFQLGASTLAVALVSLAGGPAPLALASGYGPATSGVWAAPLLPATPGTRIVQRFAVRFAFAPGDVAGLDALRATLDAAVLGAPATAAAGLALHAGPAPIRGPARVTFELPHAADVRLEAFDPAGRRLATLASGPRVAGPHALTWSPPRTAGVVLLRLRADGAVVVRRVAVLP